MENAWLASEKIKRCSWAILDAFKRYMPGNETFHKNPGIQVKLSKGALCKLKT